MRRIVSDLLFQLLWIRQGATVLLDKTSYCLPPTFPGKAGKEGSKVQVTSCLIPRSERAGLYIGADAFGALPQESKLPVMDHSCAVGGQMGNPAKIHEPIQQELATVFDQVSAVDQDDSGPARSGF